MFFVPLYWLPIAVIVTAIATFFLTRAWTLKGRNQSVIGVIMLDLKRIDPGPGSFSVEGFQQLISKVGLPSAVIYYEKFFKENFSIFAFTRDQFREIACATCVGKGSIEVFPVYLRKRAISTIAKSVTNLEEAIAEYLVINRCHCIDTDNTIDGMVKKFIKTTDHCDIVMRMITHENSIHKTAEGLKQKFEKK